MTFNAWVWVASIESGQLVHRLTATECTIEIWPRPSYCDRGKHEVHVLCNGYPTNPNPVDGCDMFPRLFFSLDRAKAEMEAFMNARGYST